MSFSLSCVRRTIAFHVHVQPPQQQQRIIASSIKNQMNTRRNLPSLTALYSNKPSSSWMDKNENFARYESQEPLVFSQNSNKSTEKQRRRRNDKRREEFNQKVMKEEEQNFRENFRGTRVFVQNIPDWVNWQSLKDHFKVAGNVVFASVSVDTNTGKSKGCGVVQFETTDMAQNAIDIMRDEPLEDGTILYVREDFQEENNSKSLNGNNGGRRGSTPPAVQWRCAEEENLTLLSPDALTTVKALIKARDEARRRRNYETSDIIREDLKSRFSVHIDDRLKQWWVSADNVVPDSIASAKGDGRWGNLKPWRQIPTTQENDSCVSADLVNGLLKQRDIARREKDFKTADMLLEEARNAPDGNLYLRIHDESRTWRIWTVERPPAPVHREISPTDQCIALVEKNDPSKVGEVRKLLSKFPGREWNILKRLREKYE
jgi:RNA recognition motif-containing protein